MCHRHYTELQNVMLFIFFLLDVNYDYQSTLNRSGKKLLCNKGTGTIEKKIFIAI